MGINMRFFIIILGSVWFQFSVQAQTMSIECNYPLNVVLNSSGETETQTIDFKLQFLIDESAEKAYMIGNNGSNEVFDIPNMGGRTFIEVTGTGNVMTTTITSELKSVHSRHTVMSIMEEPELIPSQYYGECELKN